MSQTEKMGFQRSAKMKHTILLSHVTNWNKTWKYWVTQVIQVPLQVWSTQFWTIFHLSAGEHAHIRMVRAVCFPLEVPSRNRMYLGKKCPSKKSPNVWCELHLQSAIKYFHSSPAPEIYKEGRISRKSNFRGLYHCEYIPYFLFLCRHNSYNILPYVLCWMRRARFSYIFILFTSYSPLTLIDDLEMISKVAFSVFTM